MTLLSLYSTSRRCNLRINLLTVETIIYFSCCALARKLGILLIKRRSCLILCRVHWGLNLIHISLISLHLLRMGRSSLLIAIYPRKVLSLRIHKICLAHVLILWRPDGLIFVRWNWKISWTLSLWLKFLLWVLLTCDKSVLRCLSGKSNLAVRLRLLLKSLVMLKGHFFLWIRCVESFLPGILVILGHFD